MTATAIDPPDVQPEHVHRAGTVFAIPTQLVHANRRNPRRDLHPDDEFVESIRTHGMLQPLLATRDSCNRITLIAGNRRLMAARQAGMSHVPVIIARDMRPDLRLCMAAVENLHREPMAPMDEARACAALIDAGYARRRIAHDLCRSVGWVSDRLALLELPDDAQARVDQQQLPVSEAIRLARQVRKRRAGSVTIGARCPAHFGRHHPLHTEAVHRCNTEKHPRAGRIGGACGQCWEATIRADGSE